MDNTPLINTPLYRIITRRPYGDKSITHTTDRYTEIGRDTYIKDIARKFGDAAIISVLEYNLVGIIK